MNKKEATELLEVYGGIYAYMYGSAFLALSNYYDRDKIIFIKKDELKLSDDGLFFIWGWPGPDITRYFYKDYTLTWAFKENDIKEPEPQTGCIMCSKCIYKPMRWGAQISLPASCPRSRLFLRRPSRIDFDFDGCCAQGVASESTNIFPKYRPREEDLYDVRLIQANEKEQ